VNTACSQSTSDLFLKISGAFFTLKVWRISPHTVVRVRRRRDSRGRKWKREKGSKRRTEQGRKKAREKDTSEGEWEGGMNNAREDEKKGGTEER
jgi:hypothetical protein